MSPCVPLLNSLNIVEVKTLYLKYLIVSYVSYHWAMWQNNRQRKQKVSSAFPPPALFSVFEKFFCCTCFFSTATATAPPASLPLTTKISHSLSIPGSSAGSPRWRLSMTPPFCGGNPVRRIRGTPHPNWARSGPGAHGVHSRARSGPGAHGVHSRARSGPGAHGVHSRARSGPRAHGVHSRARSVLGAHGVHSRTCPFQELTESTPEPVRSRSSQSPFQRPLRSRSSQSCFQSTP